MVQQNAVDAAAKRQQIEADLLELVTPSAPATVAVVYPETPIDWDALVNEYRPRLAVCDQERLDLIVAGVTLEMVRRVPTEPSPAESAVFVQVLSLLEEPRSTNAAARREFDAACNWSNRVYEWARHAGAIPAVTLFGLTNVDGPLGERRAGGILRFLGGHYGGLLMPALTQSVAAAVLDDILGPTTRPPFDPRWRSATAVGLAEAIHEGRAFDRLPLLADALQDEGCEEPVLLGHLRGPGPHFRGCWAVSAVLGK